MNREDSLRKQKMWGTLERNQGIRAEYRKGLGGLLARKHGITRQMIHLIINQPDLSDLSEASRDGKLARFRGWVRGFIKFFNRGG